jgi:hypothetical protein
LSNEFRMEFIDTNALEFVSRGRKSNVSPELVKALKELKTGTAVRIPSLTVTASGEAGKKDRARNSAQIRSAAKLAGVKVSILWSPAGVPQVVVSGKASSK